MNESEVGQELVFVGRGEFSPWSSFLGLAEELYERGFAGATVDGWIVVAFDPERISELARLEQEARARR